MEILVKWDVVHCLPIFKRLEVESHKRNSLDPQVNFHVSKFFKRKRQVAVNTEVFRLIVVADSDLDSLRWPQPNLGVNLRQSRL